VVLMSRGEREQRYRCDHLGGIPIRRDQADARAPTRRYVPRVVETIDVRLIMCLAIRIGRGLREVPGAQRFGDAGALPESGPASKV
jgi:hypothetical protein